MVHHRAFFSEPGVPLTKLTKLSDVFLVLRDVLRSVRLLFEEKRMVHGDLSPSNVFLVYGEDVKNNHGLVIDVEYVQGIHDINTQSELISGTYDFMAYEAGSRSCYFLPGRDQPEESGDEDDATGAYVIPTTDSAPPSLLLTPTSGVGAAEPSSEAIWKHNVLHDLESLWWIGLWAMFTFREPDAVSSADEIAQYAQLFKGDPLASARGDVIQQPAKWDSVSDSITHNRDLLPALGRCLFYIRKAYQETEKVRPNSGEAVEVAPELAQKVMKKMEKAFSIIMGLPSSRDITVVHRIPR